jgi:hypothetical protein
MIASVLTPIILIVGVIILSFKLWSKKPMGKVWKALLIISSVLVGLFLLLLLDILFGYLLGMHPHW